jgi:hypothetical protein
MKNSVLMGYTLYFRQNNSLILKLTSGQRKIQFSINQLELNKLLEN